MERPVGVTILAVLEFLTAGVLILAALLFIVGFGLLGGAAGQAGEGGGMAVLMGLGAVAGVVLLVIALIPLALGYGLWKLRNWARILVIIFSGIGVLSNLVQLAGGAMAGEIVTLTSSVVGLGINVLILWYMFQPHVKQAFGAS